METLVAITLFMIAIVSSYGVFTMGIQIWRRATGEAPVQRQTLIALEKIGEDLRSAVRLPEKKGGLSELSLSSSKQKEFELGGKNESFMVLSSVPGDENGPAYLRAAVGYRWDPAKKQLCRAAHDANALYEEREPSCRNILGNVLSVRFQYWLINPISKTFSWYDSWDAEEGMPQAVRAEIQVAVRSKKNSPVLKFERTFWLPAGDPRIGTDNGINAS